MKLLETILGNQAVLRQIAQRIGLSQEQTEAVIGHVIPVLARGLHNNAQASAELYALLSALGRGEHQRYLDEPNTLAAQTTIDDGNAILRHVFGDKDVSRNLAAYTARQTNIGSHRIKKMLPLIAAVVMGALSKETERADSTAPLGGTLEAIVANFLTVDGDNSIADKLLNLPGNVSTP